MNYEKPKLIALNGNSELTWGDCTPTGSGVAGHCTDGNSPGSGNCSTGPGAPGFCESNGIGAGWCVPTGSAF